MRDRYKRYEMCDDCEYADPYGLFDYEISYITIKGETRKASLRLCFDCLQKRRGRVNLTVKRNKNVRS